MFLFLARSGAVYAVDLPASTTHQAVFDRALQSGNPIPVWQQDLLVMRTLSSLDSVDKSQPSVLFYDRNGASAGSASIWVDGAIRVRLHTLTISANHQILAGGNAITADGKLIGYLTLTDLAGKAKVTIQTNPYDIAEASFGPDGSIWALVSLIDMDGSKRGQDYNVLRHYSAAGAFLGEMLPRSRFATRISPAASNTGAGGTVVMQSNKDHLGVFFGHANLWVEVDNSGNLQQWQVPPLPFLDATGNPTGQTKFMWTAAFLDSGSVYFHASDHYGRGLYKLDKKQLQWLPVPGTVGHALNAPVGRLYGRDGSALVFSSGIPGTLSWAPVE